MERYIDITTDRDREKERERERGRERRKRCRDIELNIACRGKVSFPYGLHYKIVHYFNGNPSIGSMCIIPRYLPNFEM